jgi:hypothetical protein
VSGGRYVHISRERRSMKTLLVAIGVVVVLVLAFLTVAPRTRSMERLRVAVLVVLGLAYLSLMVGVLVPLPSVVECDLAPENIEVRSTARQGHLQGYFDRLDIGPCALYIHHSRPIPTDSGGGD